MKMHMKKGKYPALMILPASLLCGCGPKAQLPDDALVFEQIVDKEEGYAYLQQGDKQYLPYCPYEKKYLGDCIGYCDLPAAPYTDAARVYIFALKGYPSDEWIVEMSGLDNCKEGMILRETNTATVPYGLESEYEWNN